MTQTERLRELIQSVRNPDRHFDFEPQYIPRKGWFLFPTESRYMDETGEYMGYTFKEAQKNIIDFFKM